VAFHFYLSRFWERLSELPAVFPDGDTLDRKLEPWVVLGLARPHLTWLRKNRLPLSGLEKAVATLLTYWVVPGTMLLFWARYLTRQDVRDSMLHVALAVVSTLLALWFQALMERMLRANPLSSRGRSELEGTKLPSRKTLALWMGAVLALVTVGTVLGAPHSGRRAPELGAADIRRWAAHALWALGYNPFANLSHREVSSAPAGWSGSWWCNPAAARGHIPATAPSAGWRRS